MPLVKVNACGKAGVSVKVGTLGCAFPGREEWLWAQSTGRVRRVLHETGVPPDVVGWHQQAVSWVASLIGDGTRGVTFSRCWCCFQLSSDWWELVVCNYGEPQSSPPSSVIKNLSGYPSALNAVEANKADPCSPGRSPIFYVGLCPSEV